MPVCFQGRLRVCGGVGQTRLAVAVEVGPPQGKTNCVTVLSVAWVNSGVTIGPCTAHLFGSSQQAKRKTGEEGQIKKPSEIGVSRAGGRFQEFLGIHNRHEHSSKTQC